MSSPSRTSRTSPRPNPEKFTNSVSLFLVAGYTGYIPSDMNIAVPNKGHTTHLGRDAGVDVMEKIAMETTLSRVPTSSNKAQFPVYSKNDFKVPDGTNGGYWVCLLYTSPSPRDGLLSRMPSSA